MKSKRNFEYVKGPARTRIHWHRPCPNLLNNWKEDFFKIPHVDKYKFWVCGGATEVWKTWDTDIVVTGKINEYSEIENIMVSATRIGFEHRQLIDITWNEHYQKYAEKLCQSRSPTLCGKLIQSARQKNKSIESKMVLFIRGGLFC